MFLRIVSRKSAVVWIAHFARKQWELILIVVDDMSKWETVGNRCLVS